MEDCESALVAVDSAVVVVGGGGGVVVVDVVEVVVELVVVVVVVVVVVCGGGGGGRVVLELCGDCTTLIALEAVALGGGPDGEKPVIGFTGGACSGGALKLGTGTIRLGGGAAC